MEPFDENDKTIEQALKDGDYDAVLSYEESQKDPYRIYYLEAKDDSGIAATALKELLEDYNKQLQKQKVQQLGLDADEILNPVRYEEVNYSSTEQTMGNMLGDIVPMLVIISIMMGAIYPAIDVTAGEKERGTLETLLTLPLYDGRHGSGDDQLCNVPSGNFVYAACHGVFCPVCNSSQSLHLYFCKEL